MKARVHGQARRYDQNLFSKAPRPAQDLLSLVRLFDDIDDIAEIDDRGSLQGLIGTMYGVPSSAGEAHGTQQSQVIALATAIIEQGAILREYAV